MRFAHLTISNLLIISNIFDFIPISAQNKLINETIENVSKMSIGSFCIQNFLTHLQMRNAVTIYPDLISESKVQSDFLKKINEDYVWTTTIAIDAKITASSKNVLIFITAIIESDLNIIAKNNCLDDINLIIVFLYFDATNVLFKIQQLFNYFPHDLCVNVKVFASKPNDGGYESWKIYTKATLQYNRNNLNIEPIAECHINENVIEVAEIHHPKSSGQTKYLMKVLATEFAPFTYFNKNNQLYKGIDHQLLQTIADQFQFDIQYIKAANHYFGDNQVTEFSKLLFRYHKVTKTKKIFLQFILCSGIDVKIGGRNAAILISNASKLLPSMAYEQDDITWCISRAKQIPLWLNFFHFAEGIGLWMMTLSAFILATAFVFLLTSFEEQPLDIWHVLTLAFPTLLTFVSWFKPKGSLLRLLFIITLLVAFLWSCIFNAFFFTVLTHPKYTTQLKSISEIIQEDYRLVTDINILSHLADQKLVLFVYHL